MKKLNYLLTAFVVLMSATLSAQNSINKWYVSVGAHAVDHTSVRPAFDEFFQTKNWSIVPPLSKISIARSLNNSFALDLTASVGDIDNNRLYVTSGGGVATGAKPTYQDEFFINAGLGLRYKLANGYILKETSWFDPYLRVGVNYHKFDYNSLKFSGTNVVGGKESGAKNVYGSSVSQKGGYDYLDGGGTGETNHVMVSGGVGINFWITPKFGINVASDYNKSLNIGSDYTDFFQHSAGLTFRFGNSDKDKDGILDKDDKCPETPGLAQFQGCPDTDNDGLQDSEDGCPTVAGPTENKGCPWGDKDGDGLTDNVDKCPSVAGPKDNGGCPYVDTDKDGILDKNDKCPSVPGLAKYNGCPAPKADVEINKDFNILFDTGKSTIKPESQPKLDRAVGLLKEGLSNDANATFYIDGFTDSKGDPKRNLALSQRRAAEVVKQLVKAGVPATALKARGFGQDNAIASNDTEEGRAKNRRVVAVATNQVSGTWEKFLAPPTPVKATKKGGKKKKK